MGDSVSDGSAPDTPRVAHPVDLTMAVSAPSAISTLVDDSGPISQPLPPPPARELLADRYEILGMVGVGGMGTVYRARDVELDEVVALKVLRRDLVDTPGILDRFRREVKLARRVTHRNVARVFDIGEHGGEKFLTMEFIDGDPLGQILARKGAFRVSRALDIASGICAGLASAHAAGVVHRDLKPDNVLLAKDGRVVVTDFGIARAFLDASAARSNTMGVLMGTPAYMAPEQVEGRTDIDARADIYALGALIYELLTGQRAWDGELPFAVASARLTSPPPDPRTRRHDLPSAAAELVIRCMARKPEERFPTVEDVASEITAITLPPMPASSRTGYPASRRAGTATISGLRPASAVLTSHDGSPASYRPGGVSVPPGADRFLVSESQPGDKTVAVLPFRNAGPPEDEYLAEELMDDLIDSLSMTRGLRVRSRGAVLKSRSVSSDPRDLGRELGVQVVVEGSVRRARGNVRISARLISVADGFQLWARRFDRPEKDVLSINDDAAEAIAEALTLDREVKSREAPSDPAAIDLYLRARHEYRKFWAESQDKALELFGEAEALAPGDPMILAGKAMALARRAFFFGEGVALAREVAEQAVTAAPELAEAWLALGSVLLQMGEWTDAARKLRQAISRAPGLAEAHATLGRLLSEIGALEEGIRRLEAALALDSKVPLACSALARGYVLLGDWKKFDDRIGMVREAEGEISYYTSLARMLLWRRDRVRAAELLRRLDGEANYMRIPQLLLEIAAEARLPSELAARSGEVYDEEGGLRRRAFLRQLEAEVLAHLGYVDKALSALSRVADAGLIDIVWLDRCPLFEGLRGDPAFVAIRTEVKQRADEILEAYRTL